VEGKTGQLSLDVAGLTLGLGEATLNNDGLTAPNASLALPLELGGGKVTINDVAIGAEGLALSGGSFEMPDMMMTDGTLGVTGARGDLMLTDKGYEINAQGNLNVDLPENQKSVPLTFKLDSDGNLSGDAGEISLNLAGANLMLGKAKLDNNGLSAPNALLKLPSFFGSANGGLQATLQDVSIGADGLAFSEAGLKTDLPDIGLPMIAFTSNAVEFNLIGTDTGAKYQMTLDTVAYTQDPNGNYQTSPLRLTARNASPGELQKASNSLPDGVALQFGDVLVTFASKSN